MTFTNENHTTETATEKTTLLVSDYTGQQFRSPVRYAEHIAKYQAVESRVAAIRTAIAHLRRTALDVEAVLLWCQQHAADLAFLTDYARGRVAPKQQYKKAAISTFIPTENAYIRFLNNELHCPLQGALNPMRDATLVLKYPALEIDVECVATEHIHLPEALDCLPGVRYWPFGAGTAPDSAAGNLTFYAEDWAFAGAAWLHTVLSEENASLPSHVILHMDRVLAAQFPGTRKELLLDLSRTGVLPDDVETLTAWLLDSSNKQPNVALPATIFQVDHV